MISLNLPRPVHEHRDLNATDAVVSAMMTRASARVVAGGVSAVEVAAGMVARAFALADVTPAPARIALPRCALALAGRQLVTRGEVLFALGIGRGGILALPAASWDVRGTDPDPATWRYRVDLAAPDSTRFRTVERDGVIHAIADPDSYSPWRGRGVLRRSTATAALAADLEAALDDEAKLPTGRMISIPAGTQQGTVNRLRKQIEDLSGRIMLPETTAAAFGGGAPEAPPAAADWHPRRIGPDFTAAEVSAAADASGRLLAAFGISPAYASPTATAMAIREAARSAYRGLILPLAALLEAAASEALETEVRLTFDDLAASDVIGASKAAANLKDLGVTQDRALRMAGFRATTGLQSDGSG